MSNVRAAACAWVVAIVLGSTVVRADTPAEGANPSPEVQEQARARFNSAVQLYQDGDFKLALIDFERAYSLVPSYRLLYNIGQVHQQLGHYALALGTLRRYLDEGGDKIAAERRKQVEADISSLRVRTAHLSVRVSVPDAEITFDDELLGKGAVTEHLVDAGRHRLRVTKPGYVPDERALVLAGGDRQDVGVILTELPVQTSVMPSTSTTASTEKKRGAELYIAWAATGVLAAGAGAFATLAYFKSEELQDQIGKPGTTTAERESTAETARTLGITADALTIGTILAAASAVYLTLRKPSSNATQSTPASAAVQRPRFRADLGPTFVGGTFAF